MMHHWSGQGRSRSSASLLTGLGLLLSTLVIVVSAPSARAYPQEDNDCIDSTITWHFETDPLWTADGVDRRVWVRAALNELDDPRDWDGGDLIEVEEGTGGVEVQIQYDPGGHLGSSECEFLGGTTMWVNSTSVDPKFYWQVARHEMFHLAGAEHAGKNDSRNNDNPPTMATCIAISTFRTMNKMAQDDRAYLNWLHSDLDYRQLHMNIGFSSDVGYWGATNGVMAWQSSGGSTGPGNVSFFATEDFNSSYMYQTTRLWTGDDNTAYRARMAVKKAAASYTNTYAKVAVYNRDLNEFSDSDCIYPDGLKAPNNDMIISSYVLLAESDILFATTSWQGVFTDFVNPFSYDGHDFQVRAYGVATLNGSPSGIRFDNVRAEGLAGAE